MKQSRKDKQRYFGMKAHVEVDAKGKLIHHAPRRGGRRQDTAASAASAACKKTAVWGDSAYTGKTKVTEERAPSAADFTQRRCAACFGLGRGAITRWW